MESADTPCPKGHRTDHQGYVLDPTETWCLDCNQGAGIAIVLDGTPAETVVGGELGDGTVEIPGRFIDAPPWWRTAPEADRWWPTLTALIAAADDLQGAHWLDVPGELSASLDACREFFWWLHHSGIASLREEWREQGDFGREWESLTLHVALQTEPRRISVSGPDFFWDTVVRILVDEVDDQSPVRWRRHPDGRVQVALPNICDVFARTCDDHLYFEHHPDGSWTWEGVTYGDAETLRRTGPVDLSGAATPLQVASALLDRVDAVPDEDHEVLAGLDYEPGFA